VAATASDDLGLVRIEYWGAGKLFANTACSGKTCSSQVEWATGALATAAYQVNAVAVDTTGHRTVSAPMTIYKDATSPLVASGAGTSSSTSTTPTTVLTATFTSPAAGATVSGTKTFSVGVTGASGSITVASAIDGNALLTQTVNGSTASFTVDTTKLTNATHTVSAKVTDAAGKTASASVSVKVSNTTTTTSGGTTSGGTTSTSTGSLGVYYTAPSAGATVAGTTAFTITVVGGTGSLTVAPSVDGSALSSLVLFSTFGSFSVDTTKLSNGSHTVTAKVTDGSGKTGTSSISVQVSNSTTSSTSTVPTVRITQPTGNVWTGNSIQVGASATGVSLVRIDLWGNGGIFASIPCSGSSCSGSTWWSTGSLATAAYQVNAVAVDAAGHHAISAPVYIYKDATSPTIASAAK
jgi:Bacterial Ig domain